VDVKILIPNYYLRSNYLGFTLSRISGTLRIMRLTEARYGWWLMIITKDGDLLLVLPTRRSPPMKKGRDIGQKN
jgi:hypothetical protein